MDSLLQSSLSLYGLLHSLRTNTTEGVIGALVQRLQSGICTSWTCRLWLYHGRDLYIWQI